MNSNLPESVVQRLQAERARIENGAFSSSLDVPAMLLTRQSGYQVLGQVMGACVYQIGWQWSNPNWRSNNWQTRRTQGISFEMTALSGALMSARELALSRLRAEAQLLGASGVVGVQLQLRRPEYAGQNQVEFLAIGTAVKSSHGAGQRGGQTPFTSNLSGEETWQLERAGYLPCDFVMGTCVMLQTLANNTINRMSFTILSGQSGNFEVAEYTGAIYEARETALSRLEAAARQSGAQGVVGTQVQVEEVRYLAQQQAQKSNNEIPQEVFGFTAIGTAVKPFGPRPKLDLQTAIDLT